MNQVLIGEILAVSLFAFTVFGVLIGYPVAFTLAGMSLIFAIIGNALGVFDFYFLSGLASRSTQLLVGILIRFFDESVFVLLGALHFLEGVSDLSRRGRVFDGNRIDRQAGAVFGHRRIHDLTHFFRDALTVVTEDVLCGTSPDDFTHGAFGDLTQHVVGILYTEQVIARICHLVGDREFHVDDVLVARQHQPVIVDGGDVAVGVDLQEGWRARVQRRVGRVGIGILAEKPIFRARRCSSPA